MPGTGDAAEAAKHFARALPLDPLRVVARLGLGVAMEEGGDLDAAYAAYLRACELNPTLDSVRDELLRLRSTLNDRLPSDDPAGSDRLLRTRFGLAVIHARNGH